MNQYPELELARLFPSPTNPRKTFNQADLQSLADSIKTQGIIQPIVVRESVEAITEEYRQEWEAENGSSD